MDRVLPSEILIKIFMSLPVDDIQSAADTCVHWKNIVQSFNIWESHWLQLLRTANKTNLDESLCLFLKKYKTSDLDLKHSCICLKNVLYNEHNQIHKCFLDDSVRTCEYGLLKTHYSEVSLTFINNILLQRSNYFHQTKRKNDAHPNCKSYMSFRTPPKILESIDFVFNVNGHKHVRQLVYVYPLGMTAHMEAVIARLLEVAHVADLVLVPRVLTLCENLEVQDAVVVYSTSRSTEVALVVDGRVAAGRWVELPVGGWQVAQNLHATFTWLHPSVPLDPRRFDEPRIKTHCFLKMSNHLPDMRNMENPGTIFFEQNRGFVLKDEQYLATELMYTELGLCAVISRLAAGLDETVLERCLSHVLLAGGNCQLKFFNLRFRCDLKKLWPQHAATISTSVHGSRALVYTPARSLLEPPLHPGLTFLPGQPCRITRSLYIRGATVQ